MNICFNSSTNFEIKSYPNIEKQLTEQDYFSLKHRIDEIYKPIV